MNVQAVHVDVSQHAFPHAAEVLRFSTPCKSWPCSIDVLNTSCDSQEVVCFVDETRRKKNELIITTIKINCNILNSDEEVCETLFIYRWNRVAHTAALTKVSCKLSTSVVDVLLGNQ